MKNNRNGDHYNREEGLRIQKAQYIFLLNHLCRYETNLFCSHEMFSNYLVSIEKYGMHGYY